MQVIGYTRVSTEDQARDGVSLDSQRTKIAAYCVVKDWPLVEVIRDEGQPSKPLNRPGLQRLLAVVECRQVEAVIVYKLDRLTRSVSDLDKLMKLFERKDVALVSLQERLDATTATGRLDDEPTRQRLAVRTRSHRGTDQGCHAASQSARESL